MRASSKGVRSGRILPADPFVLGPPSLVARAFRLRLRTPPSRKVPTVSGFGRVHRFLGASCLRRHSFGSDGRAFREAAFFFFSFLFSHFVGPDRGARRIVRKAGAAAPVEQLVQLVRLVPLVAVDAPRPSSQRLQRFHIPATIATRVAFFAVLHLFARGLSSRAFLRILLHVSLRASPRKGRLSFAKRCRPSGLSGRACRGGGR